MGRDKALLEFRGIPLQTHLIRLLSTVASPVRIVGNEDLPDRFPGYGPMGGIQTAPAVSESEANLIVAVDLPLLEPAFLKWFRDRIIQSAKPIVAGRIGKAFPLCLGIHRSIAPEVSGRIAAGNLAIQRFIQESNSYILAEEEIHAAGFPRSIFHNVNTPEDWNSLA